MIYERYLKLINEKIAEGRLTQEFISTTKYRLGEFKKKSKITKKQYDALIDLLDTNNN